MHLRLATCEWYPVITSADEWTPAVQVDVPDDLAQEFTQAEVAFQAAHQRMQAYLRAVERDDTAYQHDADVNRRRLERGRRRHFRRARPERTH